MFTAVSFTAPFLELLDNFFFGGVDQLLRNRKWSSLVVTVAAKC